MPKSRTWRASMTMRSGEVGTGALSCGRSRGNLPAIERKAFGKFGNAAPDGCDRGPDLSGVRAQLFHHFGDQRGHLSHLRRTEAARSYGGAAEPDSARVERRVHVEGDA